MLQFAAPDRDRHYAAAAGDNANDPAGRADDP
jgi:hypothetical protein